MALPAPAAFPFFLQCVGCCDWYTEEGFVSRALTVGHNDLFFGGGLYRFKLETLADLETLRDWYEAVHTPPFDYDAAELDRIAAIEAM